MLNDILAVVGIPSLTVAMLLCVLYLSKIFIEKKLQLDNAKAQIEIDSKNQKQQLEFQHSLDLLSKRFDYLHQERARAAVDLLRSIRNAASHVDFAISRFHVGKVSSDVAKDAAYKACVETHNLINNNDFFFEPRMQELLYKLREILWSTIDEINMSTESAKERGENVLRNKEFMDLWPRLIREFKPAEKELVEEIQLLLGFEHKQGG